MATYIVVYDLNEPGQKWKEIDKIVDSAYGTHWRFQDSTWMIETSESAVQIHNRLAAAMDVNDLLFVGQLQGEAAWSGYDEAGNKWIGDRLA